MSKLETIFQLNSINNLLIKCESSTYNMLKKPSLDIECLNLISDLKKKHDGVLNKLDLNVVLDKSSIHYLDYRDVVLENMVTILSFLKRFDLTEEQKQKLYNDLTCDYSHNESFDSSLNRFNTRCDKYLLSLIGSYYQNKAVDVDTLISIVQIWIIFLREYCIVILSDLLEEEILNFKLTRELDKTVRVGNLYLLTINTKTDLYQVTSIQEDIIFLKQHNNKTKLISVYKRHLEDFQILTTLPSRIYPRKI